MICPDDKMRVRRRMAKTSFAVILATLASCFLLIAFGNEGVSGRFQAASGTINTLLVCLTSLVVGYGASVHHSDFQHEKNQNSHAGSN